MRLCWFRKLSVIMQKSAGDKNRDTKVIVRNVATEQFWWGAMKLPCFARNDKSTGMSTPTNRASTLSLVPTGD
jgi:hypothetical protein